MQHLKASGQGSFSNIAATNTAPILVFSHLRWDFVTQRPQHLIRRLAKYSKVLFIEEPIPYSLHEEGSANMIEVHPNIQVLQPKVHPNDLIDSLETLIRQQEDYLYPETPVLWFYSSAFHEITERLPYSMIVYDCMDELSAFRGAPVELIGQEKQLLQKADLVFTGGKSLYEAKKSMHRNVYCYPSSVDAAHFNKALLPETNIPSDIANIPHPIAGYYGVIDERIDYALLAEAARLNPDVSFVMIGPVVKVDPADLPQEFNLYYLGNKAYEALPNYLKAFDIAIMPFALNESTQFISPTKTLEYLAARKPVISTPVFDVVRDYGDVIAITGDAGEFTVALKNILEEDYLTKMRRLERYRTILDAVSWDKTIMAMQRHMEAVKSTTILTRQLQESSQTYAY